MFVFEPPIGARTGLAPPRPSPDSRTDAPIAVAAVSSVVEGDETPVDKQQQKDHAVVVGGECERGDQLSEKLDGGASEMLDRLGIGEPTRSELLGLAHVTEAYLEGWLAWYGSQERLGPGWVVTQIRQGAAPPPSRRERDAAARRRYLAWSGE
jgi:hypothetical protein